MSPITVETAVSASLEKVWEYWTSPQHIEKWAFAADDWQASDAENDLRVGGRFKTRLSAKDGSAGFDFTGTYTAVREREHIEYDMDDGRHVQVEFTQVPQGVRVVEKFDPESENPPEMQRAGWQAFLDNFKKHVEG